LKKYSLVAVFVFLLAAINGSAYDFSTETITGVVGEEAGVWPAFNITLDDLADAGIRIAITDPNAIMAIYRLSDIGKAMGTTVYIEEWSSSPPILFMDKNGSLGHSVANTSQVHTQTRVIIYDEESGEIQQRVIDPWGTTARIAQRVKYSV
jgi:hypothetical protein